MKRENRIVAGIFSCNVLPGIGYLIGGILAALIGIACGGLIALILYSKQ